MRDICSFLAPPGRDENGSPHNFRKDELVQFLRVCFLKEIFILNIYRIFYFRILVKQQIYH
jgi:hypothetical protein